MAFVFCGLISPDLEETDWARVCEGYPVRTASFKSPFSGSAAVLAVNHETSKANAIGNKDWRNPDRNPFFRRSSLFPEARIIWFELSCFGGDCCEAGLAFRNGVVLMQSHGWVEAPAVNEQARDTEFQRLAMAIGLERPDPYFELFDRDFWPQNSG